MPHDNGTAMTYRPETGAWTYSSCEYDDFTAQERGLDGFHQHYRQMSKGSFSGRIESLQVGDTNLMRERCNRALENEFRFPDSMMCIAFAIGDKTSGKGNFGAIQPGGGIMPPAGRDNCIYMKEEADLLILSMPDDPEISACRSEAGVTGATFTSWLCTILDIARQGYGRDDLMAVLPGLIRDHLSILRAGEPSEQCATVRDRAIFDEIATACASLMPEDMTVSGLSDRLDRTRAELRRACLAMSGIRLDDMLSAWRMNDVYRALRGAGPCSIGQTALDYGYMHAGRFSLAFREMFGMRPKDARGLGA